MAPVTDDNPVSDRQEGEESGEMNQPPNMDEASCVDGIKNGDETDIDCGGEVCGGVSMVMPVKAMEIVFMNFANRASVSSRRVFSDWVVPSWVYPNRWWLVRDGFRVRKSREAPRHNVNISSFQLMRAEVTVGQYRQCVEDGACAVPGEFGDELVTYSRRSG